ncbi:TPA: helix-turn-helix domain-containing protein [Legionella pneumophila subsp. pneumophila]|uniref:XRE family transcriptional regulator n=1 Tax=Legionella pneumophila TaxID=446 RepID=UPI000770B153|nr:XRE family transcriptional regulator [Legionella pneumophila]CZG83610.1 Helix-turn-helix domain [Legionella pneumophila]HAT9405318.1 helix-turn-helix domain-containing protein [Legionella pneumophila subsp. pneumophila]HEL8001191.1 helix-turn-helix domain-containing protein [Legionella pneumophila]
MKNATKVKKDSSAMGQRIKRARMLAGLSRKDLEEKHGISIHTLQSWELGRNPLNKAKAASLVEILNQYDVSCSIDWLLEGIGKGPSVIENEFQNYPFLADTVGNLLASEQAIQKEIDFFKTNNPNAVVITVSDDAMEPEYKVGDIVGGIKFINQNKKNQCVGHNCIVETTEGTFFRRLIKSENKYLLVCNNNRTSVSDPVISADSILSIAPVIWHRWKFDALSN